MTRILRRRRRAEHALPVDQVHTPHWSWSRKDGPPAGEALAPEDFWARLGI
jgi:hypothetical protein